MSRPVKTVTSRCRNRRNFPRCCRRRRRSKAREPSPRLPTPGCRDGDQHLDPQGRRREAHVAVMGRRRAT
eukprot:3300991-Rhodomonas_salina.1